MISRYIKSISGSAFFVPVLIFILYSVLTVIYSRNFERNLTGFACMGDYFNIPEITGQNFFVYSNSPGYDGQFYYYMCHDLLLKKNYYSRFDIPGYRYQRIMYPLLVKIFSFNSVKLYPFMLVFVNILAICLGTYISGLLLLKMNLSVNYSLYYGLMGGLCLCVMRDLAEPVALLFMTLAVYFYVTKKYTMFGISLSCMLLSREVYVLFLPFLIFDSLFINRNVRALIWALLSLVPWILWEVYISSVMEISPFHGGTGNFSAPFRGLIAGAKNLFCAEDAFPERLHFIATVFIVFVSAVISLIEICKRRDAISMAFVFFSIFPFFLSFHVWRDPWSYGRVLLPLYFLIIVNFMMSSMRKPYLILIFAQMILFWSTLKFLRFIFLPF